MNRLPLLAGALGLATAASAADTFEIVPFTYQQWLGGAQASRVEGIARDASVIVGSVCRLGDFGCGGRAPAIWLPSLHMFNLPRTGDGPDELALAASNDAGRVIVGSTTGIAATRWIGGPDGTVERFLEPPKSGGVARDVSADGAVIVGETAVYDEDFFGHSRGFVKIGDGPVELLPPADGYVHSRAYALTADATFIAGSSWREPGPDGFIAEAACLWPLNTLEPIVLPPFAPGAATAAFDISSDGCTVVGVAGIRDPETGFDRHLAVRWRRGPEGWLPPENLLPDHDCHSCLAAHVSADGSVIVGRHQRASTFVWQEGLGAMDLAERLASRGIDLDDWTFPEVNGLSDDGRTIVGNLFKRVCECSFCDCSLFYAAYRVTLGTCPADFDASGDVTSADFFSFLAAFFEGSASADFNASGTVDSQDFFAFVAAFFTGC